MQKKEYLIDAFASMAKKAVAAALDKPDLFEFLDGEGNPFKPEEEVSYKILGEDGTVLKEGTIKDEHTISLKDIPTTKFSVIVDSYTVSNPRGFEYVDQEGTSRINDLFIDDLSDIEA